MATIDPSYPVVSHRIDFGKETRLVYANEELNAYIEKRWPGRTQRKQKEAHATDPKFTFITEMFFFTLRSFHVGFLRTCSRFLALEQALKREQAMRRDFLATRSDWSPEQTPHHEAVAEKMRATVENILKSMRRLSVLSVWCSVVCFMCYAEPIPPYSVFSQARL